MRKRINALTNPRIMAELLYQRDIYGKTLIELGKENKDIVVLDADLSSSTRTSFFAKEFPERFFNFGVAEQNMMATAAGLASCGTFHVSPSKKVRIRDTILVLGDIYPSSETLCPENLRFLPDSRGISAY